MLLWVMGVGFENTCIVLGNEMSPGLFQVFIDYRFPCNPSGGEILLRASASYNKLLGRVAFRILPNIHSGAPPRKKSTTLRHRLFPQKSSNADVKLDSKCAFGWKGAVNVGCR